MSAKKVKIRDSIVKSRIIDSIVHDLRGGAYLNQRAYDRLSDLDAGFIIKNKIRRGMPYYLSFNWMAFMKDGGTVRGLSNDQLDELFCNTHNTYIYHDLMVNELKLRLSGELSYNPDGEGYNLEKYAYV